jgi:DNA-binding MarR family transcriptional regulator
MARRRDPNEFIDQLAAIRRTVSALAAQAYAQLGLGRTQAMFLRHIGRNSRISQAELARATVTDPALTGRVLQTLIDRGLVRRERSERDRREYVLELSATGKRARERVEKLRAQIAAEVVAVLSERDLDDFDRIAEKIIVALEPRPRPSVA